MISVAFKYQPSASIDYTDERLRYERYFFRVEGVCEALGLKSEPGCYYFTYKMTKIAVY